MVLSEWSTMIQGIILFYLVSLWIEIESKGKYWEDKLFPDNYISKYTHQSTSKVSDAPLLSTEQTTWYLWV